MAVEAADVGFPDPEIEQILKNYSRFWPYEALDLDSKSLAATVDTSQMILQNLNKIFSQPKKETAAQKKEREAKRKEM